MPAPFRPGKLNGPHRLAPRVASRREKLQLAEDGLPAPLHWRLVIQVRSLLVGSVLTVGGDLLLQQLGATTLSVSSLVASLALGLALGVAAPSLGRLVGVLWVNALLRKARKGVKP
jgi:hypothetical protein